MPVCIHGSSNDCRFCQEDWAKEKSQSEERSMTVTSSKDLKEKVSDVEIFGDPDTWRLLCKAGSQSQGWFKSTKAMEVPGGIVVQTCTQQGVQVSEALVFIPGVELTDNETPPKIIPIIE